MGKVLKLQVREGDMVTRGQLLLEIDPRSLETTVQNREASLATVRSQLDQMTGPARELQDDAQRRRKTR